MKSLSHRRHKFFLAINKSNSDFNGSSTFRKFTYNNIRNEASKMNHLFTINYDKLNNVHRKILHSKLKSNPKYNQLEIQSYSNNKNEKYNKFHDFFLTTNKNTINTDKKIKNIKKSRNKSSLSKKVEELNISRNKGKKNKTMYPNFSRNMNLNMDKYYLNITGNRYIKDFIDESRLINKLKYINKIKFEKKEKKENEISIDMKLIDIHCKSLLSTEHLYQQYEVERNHYNRHLFNDVIMNKQILLKLKMKKNQAEGKILNLIKKIDDLKNKSNLLSDYKNFILSIKNHIEFINQLNLKYLNAKLEKDKKEEKTTSNINNNTINKTIISRRNSIAKKNPSLIPILKKKTFNITSKYEYNSRNKTFKKRKTIVMNENKINNIIHKDSIGKRRNSYSQIFDSPMEFNFQMKKIKETLFSLLIKRNKLYSELIKLKLEKEEEIKANKINTKIDSQIKIKEELLKNYKEYNKDLTDKLNSLIKEKEDNSFYILIFEKIEGILSNINKNYKTFKNNEIIFEKYKKLLITRARYQTISSTFIADGIIIIDLVMVKLLIDINNYKNNSNDKNILNKIKLKIEKDKKIYAGRQTKDDIIKRLKFDFKVIEKMNKIYFTTRKVPEKINFKKTKK